MRSTLSFSLMFLLLGSALGADSDLVPSLGVAFPLKKEGQQLVTRVPVLLNTNDILPAGTVLHRLFPKPQKEDKDVKSRRVEDFNTDKYAAVQRFAIENREVNKDKSAVLKAAEDRAKGSPMTDELKFRALLHRMNIEEYYLAYDVAGEELRRLGQFDYPEGLLLGEENGRVLVLAVRKGSVPEGQGIVAGAVLKELNGVELKSLEDFRNRYFTEKEERKKRFESLSLGFLREGETALKVVEVEVKRSLGTANDLMSDMNAELNPRAEAGEKEVPTTKEKAPVPEVKKEVPEPILIP
ncbi:MAG: hypothetical protein HC904_10820 [Blastochloris sp.]|nr:hypothetical protein [Blastochloris sp.]